MNLLSILKSLRFTLGVFAVFISFTLVLRFVTKGFPENITISTLFSEKELLMGVIIAIMVTFMHIQKQKRNS
jgi:hypothetical protein